MPRNLTPCARLVLAFLLAWPSPPSFASSSIRPNTFQSEIITQALALSPLISVRKGNNGPASHVTSLCAGNLRYRLPESLNDKLLFTLEKIRDAGFYPTRAMLRILLNLSPPTLRKHIALLEAEDVHETQPKRNMTDVTDSEIVGAVELYDRFGRPTSFRSISRFLDARFDQYWPEYDGDRLEILGVDCGFETKYLASRMPSDQEVLPILLKAAEQETLEEGEKIVSRLGMPIRVDGPVIHNKQTGVSILLCNHIADGFVAEAVVSALLENDPEQWELITDRFNIGVLVKNRIRSFYVIKRKEFEGSVLAKFALDEKSNSLMKLNRGMSLIRSTGRPVLIDAIVYVSVSRNRLVKQVRYAWHPAGSLPRQELAGLIVSRSDLRKAIKEWYLDVFSALFTSSRLPMLEITLPRDMTKPVYGRLVETLQAMTGRPRFVADAPIAVPPMGHVARRQAAEEERLRNWNKLVSHDQAPDLVKEPVIKHSRLQPSSPWHQWLREYKQLLDSEADHLSFSVKQNPQDRWKVIQGLAYQRKWDCNYFCGRYFELARAILEACPYKMDVDVALRSILTFTYADSPMLYGDDYWTQASIGPQPRHVLHALGLYMLGKATYRRQNGSSVSRLFEMSDFTELDHGIAVHNEHPSIIQMPFDQPSVFADSVVSVFENPNDFGSLTEPVQWLPGLNGLLTQALLVALNTLHLESGGDPQSIDMTNMRNWMTRLTQWKSAGRSSRKAALIEVGWQRGLLFLLPRLRSMTGKRDFRSIQGGSPVAIKEEVFYGLRKMVVDHIELIRGSSSKWFSRTGDELIPCWAGWTKGGYSRDFEFVSRQLLNWNTQLYVASYETESRLRLQDHVSISDDWERRRFVLPSQEHFGFPLYVDFRFSILHNLLNPAVIGSAEKPGLLRHILTELGYSSTVKARRNIMKFWRALDVAPSWATRRTAFCA